jgi:uncharacterized RmlC-like cupin family protein
MRDSLFAEEILLVTNDNLTDGPNTPGQSRQTAFTTDGLWVGECRVTARNIPSQWHHHADYDSVMYMLAGRIRVDWGDEGEKSFEMGPGDYGFFKRGVIHRAQIIDGDEDCRYVFVRIGSGESVINVDGPGRANLSD